MDANELMEMISDAKDTFGGQEAVMIGELCVAAAKFGKWIVDNNYPMPSNGEEGLALLFKILLDEEETFDRVNSWIEGHAPLFDSMKENLENKGEAEESGD